MIEIWNELMTRENVARLDTKEYEAAVYGGVKFVKEGNKIMLLSTESDYYQKVSDDIVGVFLEKGLDEGIKAYKKDKYERIMDYFKSPTVAKRMIEKISKL